MTKQPLYTTIGLAHHRVIKELTGTLGKSKSWFIENAILDFGHKVSDFIKDEDVKEYLGVVNKRWQQDIKDEILKYYMKHGFMLKNSLKKVMQMIADGVEKEFILKVIKMYEKITIDDDYKDILLDLREKILIMDGERLKKASEEMKTRINYMDLQKKGKWRENYVNQG